MRFVIEMKSGAKVPHQFGHLETVTHKIQLDQETEIYVVTIDLFSVSCVMTLVDHSPLRSVNFYTIEDSWYSPEWPNHLRLPRIEIDDEVGGREEIIVVER